MKRRGFLAGAAAAARGARAAVAVAAVPVLYGDGVHDDARALEVAMNGGRVNWSDGKPVGSVISGKRFLCGSMVTVRGELKRSVIGNVFTVTEEHRLRLEQGSQSVLRRT